MNENGKGEKDPNAVSNVSNYIKDLLSFRSSSISHGHAGVRSITVDPSLK